MNELSQSDAPSQYGWADNCTILPPANIFSRGDEYVIELEMPGVNREGLEINLDGNALTITGRPLAAQAPGKLIYSETTGRDFRRCFELSTDVDMSRIRADLHQGVLCLHLPKAEQSKPRKIKIE